MLYNTVKSYSSCSNTLLHALLVVPYESSKRKKKRRNKLQYFWSNITQGYGPKVINVQKPTVWLFSL